MELRELRYMVALAEARHFGRAAEVLHVSQPSLSYSIKRLEQSLGVKLFNRHARGIDLTEAGDDLLRDATAILQQVARMEQVAERHRGGSAGTLRIGFQASAAGQLSTRARAEFARRHPEVTIVPRSYDWQQEVTALRTGDVDVAFIWLPADCTGIEYQVLCEEDRICVLSRQHRLSERTSLSIMDLTDEHFLRSRGAPAYWLDWWLVNPRPDGSAPLWCRRTAENTEELLEQVAEGEAVGIVPASVANYYARADLTFIPITDIERLSIAIGWLEGNDSPLVARFASVVRALADASGEALSQGDPAHELFAA